MPPTLAPSESYYYYSGGIIAQKVLFTLTPTRTVPPSSPYPSAQENSATQVPSSSLPSHQEHFLTRIPSYAPSDEPSYAPSDEPSQLPSAIVSPSCDPTSAPYDQIFFETQAPSVLATVNTTSGSITNFDVPSLSPTDHGLGSTAAPSEILVTMDPSQSPSSKILTKMPTNSPSMLSKSPSLEPTFVLSLEETKMPTVGAINIQPKSLSPSISPATINNELDQTTLVQFSITQEVSSVDLNSIKKNPIAIGELKYFLSSSLIDISFASIEQVNYNVSTKTIIFTIKFIAEEFDFPDGPHAFTHLQSTLQRSYSSGKLQLMLQTLTSNLFQYSILPSAPQFSSPTFEYLKTRSPTVAPTLVENFVSNTYYAAAIKLSYTTVGVYVIFTILGVCFAVLIFMLRRKLLLVENGKAQNHPFFGIAVNLVLACLSLCTNITLFYNLLLRNAFQAQSNGYSSLPLIALGGQIFPFAYSSYLISKIIFNRHQNAGHPRNIYQYLIAESAHNLLYVAVFTSMLFSVNTVIYLPWFKSNDASFVKRSGGYPCFWVLKECLVVTFSQSLMSLICSMTSFIILFDDNISYSRTIPLVIATILFLVNSTKLLLALVFERTRVNNYDILCPLQQLELINKNRSFRDLNSLKLESLGDHQEQQRLEEGKFHKALSPLPSVDSNDTSNDLQILFHSLDVKKSSPTALSSPKNRSFRLDNLTGDNCTSVEYAKENIDVLKSQVLGLGSEPLEFIPLQKIEVELHNIFELVNSGKPYNENRLNRLLGCLEFNPDYKKKLENDTLQWRKEIAFFLRESLLQVRGFIPPDIFTCTKDQMIAFGLSNTLALRIWSKKCLWLLRMNPSDIEKRIHYADFAHKYSIQSQNLDIVEMAAIFAVIPSRFSNDVNGAKERWRAGLESNLKVMYKGYCAGTLPPSKMRHPLYKDQLPVFAQKQDLFIMRSVSSRNAFRSLKERKSMTLEGNSEPSEYDSTDIDDWLFHSRSKSPVLENLPSAAPRVQGKHRRQLSGITNVSGMSKISSMTAFSHSNSDVHDPECLVNSFFASPLLELNDKLLKGSTSFDTKDSSASTGSPPSPNYSADRNYSELKNIRSTLDTDLQVGVSGKKDSSLIKELSSVLAKRNSISSVGSYSDRDTDISAISDFDFELDVTSKSIVNTVHVKADSTRRHSISHGLDPGRTVHLTNNRVGFPSHIHKFSPIPSQHANAGACSSGLKRTVATDTANTLQVIPSDKYSQLKAQAPDTSIKNVLSESVSISDGNKSFSLTSLFSAMSKSFREKVSPLPSQAVNAAHKVELQHSLSECYPESDMTINKQIYYSLYNATSSSIDNDISRLEDDLQLSNIKHILSCHTEPNLNDKYSDVNGLELNICECDYAYASSSDYDD